MKELWAMEVVLVSTLISGAHAAPSIAKGGIVNSASYARDGALNRGIAQGPVFAV